MSMTVVLVAVSTIENAAGITTQLLGIAALATLPAAVAALAYRSFADEQIPRWLAVATGVAVVALYLGTAPALETVLDADTEPGELSTALFNVGALVLGGGGAVVGRAVGDRFGVDVLVWTPTQETGDDVGRLAQTVGQVTTVALPTTIEDASGYDPIPDRTKDELAGKQFVFPRGLTVAELEQRVTAQLRSDYGVGTADMKFDEYANLSTLAVGTRAAGIGATLPPATNAIAVRADPGFSASTGDIVQIWEPDSMQRVLTGELRGVSDDVVTIAIDAADTPKVDPTRRYRLVTLPVNDRPDREFASLLRAAEETFSSVTVEAGSPLHGLPVGALDLTITAIRPEAGDPVPFPDSNYRLAPGDLLFVIARPGELRRLEDGAEPLDPTAVSREAPLLPTDEAEPAEGIQAGEPTATAREEPTGEDGLPAGEPSTTTGEDGVSAGDTATDEDGPPADDQSPPSGEGGVAAGPPSTSGSNSADEVAADSTTEENAVSGQADADSFEKIKSQFDEEASPESETENRPEESSDGETTSFDELKSEFESGEANWDDDASKTETDAAAGSAESPSDGVPASDSDELAGVDDVEIAFAEDETTESEAETDDSEDELVSLEEADISFADESADDEGDDSDDEGDDSDDAGALGDVDIDDNLQGDADDSLADDIGDLDFEDEAEEDVADLDLSDDDGLFSDDDSETETDEETDDDDEDDEEDDESDTDDDSGGSSGGSSFAQLKEEFESGDADWDDDVSDSPGGDMRLDE